MLQIVLYIPPMRKLVKPAGRFCVDILTGQNDEALGCYREYGGLELSSREKGSRGFVVKSVLGGLECVDVWK